MDTREVDELASYISDQIVCSMILRSRPDDWWARDDRCTSMLVEIKVPRKVRAFFEGRMELLCGLLGISQADLESELFTLLVLYGLSRYSELHLSEERLEELNQIAEEANQKLGAEEVTRLKRLFSEKDAEAQRKA